MGIEREIVEVVVIGKDAASGAFGKVAGSLGAIGTIATGLVVGLLAAAAAITTIGVQSVGTAVSVESAFAGILKTTDGLGDSFFDLTEQGENVLQQFRDLSKEVPLTVEELMHIGELGGQLGVANEALSGFTKVIADLGVSTNLTTESAATDLARLANIYDVASGDLVDNTQRVGSVVVDLGNNFAATEADIVSFGLRLASAGRVAGFTQEDILAIGAAMSSVGVESERGGTAVQKVILSMAEAVALGGDKLEMFANTAGWSSDEFIDAWGSDPAKAFASFVEGLGDSGDGAFAILDDLGLKDQRLIQAFLALSNAGGLLNETLDASSSAWEENSALTEEAAKRYATTEATWETIKNKVRDIGLSIGMYLLPAVKELLDVAGPIIEEFSGFVSEKLGEIKEFFDQSAEWKIVKFGEFLPDGWLETGGAFLGLLFSIGDFWATHGPGIEESANNVFGGISDFIADISEKMAPFIEDVLNRFSLWFEENGPAIEQAIANISTFFTEYFLPVLAIAFDVVLVNIGGIIDAFLNLVSFIVNVFAGEWKAAWDSLVDLVVGIFSTLLEAVEVGLDGIFQLFNYSMDEFKEDWREFWAGIAETASEVWDSIVKTFSSNFNFGSTFDFKPSYDFGSGKSGLGVNIGAANGFSGVIPPGYPNDSFIIGVTSGETVAVAPANAPTFSGAGASGGAVSVVFNYSPQVSLASEDEALDVLLPYILKGIRDAQQTKA